MRLTRWTITNTVLVLLVAGGGVLAYTTVGVPSAAASKATTRTATVGMGTVLSTISSTGNVTAPNDISVNFATAGKLTQLAVKVGDVVKEGQLLGRVDSTAAQAALDSAKAQLASAQSNLSELNEGATSLVKQGLDLSNEQSQQQVTQAEAGVTTAQQSMAQDETQQQANIAQAKTQLANDQATVNQDKVSLAASLNEADEQLSADQTTLTDDETIYGTTASNVVGDAEALNVANEAATNANLQLTLDKNTLSSEQAGQTPDCMPTTAPACVTDEANANSAITAEQTTVSADQAAVTAAQTVVSNDKIVSGDQAKVTSDATAITNTTNSNAAKSLADSQELAKDAAAITTAQTSGAAAIVKDQQAVKSAQTSVTNAQLSMEMNENSNAQKTAPPLPSAVETDQAQVEQAQATVDADQTTLDGTALTAPAAGTVGTINDTVGQTVSAGTTSSGSSSSASTTGTTTGAASSSSTSSAFLTLTNLTDLQVVADVDEADASKVVVGSPATVTLDAITGKEFAAHVIEVSNTSITSSNVVEYPVTFQIDTVDSEIKPGMTASVSVVTDKVDDALNVTSAAVRTTGTTSYVLVVQPNGTTKQVDVVVGTKGDTTTQIIGNVKAGDMVTLPVSTVSATSTTSRTGTTGTTGLTGLGGLTGAGGFGGAAGGFGGAAGGGAARGGGRG